MMLAATLWAQGTELTFTGTARRVLTEPVEAATGLTSLYVLPSTTGVSATYRASSQNVKWLKWGSRGAAYAEEIPASDIRRNGNSYTLINVEGDCGYTVEDGSKIQYYWVVDYSKHEYDVTSVSVSDESDCAMTTIVAEGSADRIGYYSINARGYELSRDIHVTYTTATPDEENLTFNQTSADEIVAHISGNLHVPAPLCDTYFKVSGDKFLEAWGMGKECSTGYYNTQAVEGIVKVEQSSREVENEQKPELESSMLGGSAPCEVSMSAAVSDGAIFREWQITNDPSFNDVLIRLNELETSYTFNELGTYYVRFVCADASGKCEWISAPYTVFIGESRLLCPNAFSPNASPGVNDEWKVSYRSIVSFECHIFNKWGEKMIELTDPSQGWDGKHGGKYVPAGVYYYVIKAMGADGVKYDLSGDINIVNYK